MTPTQDGSNDAKSYTAKRHSVRIARGYAPRGQCTARGAAVVSRYGGTGGGGTSTWVDKHRRPRRRFSRIARKGGAVCWDPIVVSADKWLVTTLQERGAGVSTASSRPRAVLERPR